MIVVTILFLPFGQFYFISLKLMAKQFITVYTHSTADPVYAVPDDIASELKQKVSTTRSPPQNNERSHRQETKIEIQYEKPVLASNGEITTKSRTTEPLILTTHTSYNIPSEQMGDERIYQPLVPPKTYKGPQETSAYQDLAFETREPEGRVVNNSEGQYKVNIVLKKEMNACKPLSFGGGGCEEGAYQPLIFQGEESSID